MACSRTLKAHCSSSRITHGFTPSIPAAPRASPPPTASPSMKDESTNFGGPSSSLRRLPMTRDWSAGQLRLPHQALHSCVSVARAPSPPNVRGARISGPASWPTSSAVSPSLHRARPLQLHQPSTTLHAGFGRSRQTGISSRCLESSAHQSFPAFSLHRCLTCVMR